MAISVRNVSKSFAGNKILDQLSLEVLPGQLLTLLGPSGCGKTTLLRIIAGLDRADRGQVLFHGQDSSSWDFRRRKVGFVFQNYALFRHMTIADNISFGLRMLKRKERPSKEQQIGKVDELLNLVQLTGLARRYPHQLSGGQLQRVALARAMAIEPEILLLDEPFGALDAKVRKDLRTWLRELQQSLGLTCILVTHDQEEAMEISDHVVLLNRGRIEQQGSPEALFEHPSTYFAMSFLGQTQALPWSLNPKDDGRQAYIRPHEIDVLGILPLADPAGKSQSPELLGRHAAEIRKISLRGATVQLQLSDGSDCRQPYLMAEIGRDALERSQLKVGDRVCWKARRYHVF